MATAGGIEFFVRLAATLLLARILAPEDFGLVAMVMALTGMVDIAKDLGLGTATVQRKDITQREISSLFWINVTVGGLLALAFIALSPAIAWFYEDSRLTMITLPLATTLLWGGMVVQHEALLSRQMKQGHLALIRLAATLVSSAGGIALALVGFGYWALIVREVARSVVYLFGVLWACRWKPDLLLRPHEIRGFLSFARDLTLNNAIFSLLIAKIDGILVGKFFGPVALGVYRQAHNLIMAPVEQFNGPISSVAQPGLSLLQSDPDRYRCYYQRVVGFVAMVTMPLGIFVAIYSEEITMLVLGEKWLAVVPLLSAFAVAAALRPTIATTGIVLVTTGRTRVLLGLTLIHSLILGVFLIAGLPWGALGIATAHVATTVALIAPNLYYSLHGSPITLGSFISAIRMSLVSAVFMGASLIVLKHMFPMASYSQSILVGIGIGAASYVLPWLLLPSGQIELRSVVGDVRDSLFRSRTLASVSPLK
jgi:PST family polysaccharide transporter